MAGNDAPEEVLSFWFDDVVGDDFKTRSHVWFGKNPAFDTDIQKRFGSLRADAAAGKLTDWERSARAALGLVIVLDQFPRNIFRGTPQAFATDAMALATAKRAIENGFDRQLRPVERLFLYLPFEHAESLADQERSVALSRTLGDPGSLDYAERHRAIIARFGRFPHRNAILGRASTPEEIAFLAEPGSSF
jgi:uncharacterized protein (DUF924 family)